MACDGGDGRGKVDGIVEAVCSCNLYRECRGGAFSDCLGGWAECDCKVWERGDLE